ncbi:PQQ-binding-like beta-propeller repeat protein [Euzebya sp.]|uniref:outer membrane protein assembly factor BamB family protein n=1 Tax=Euzebya sp. TaxID=1971409 RepID=UPI003514F410
MFTAEGTVGGEGVVWTLESCDATPVDGLVVVPAGSQTLGIDATTGEVRWTAATAIDENGSAAVSGDQLVTATPEGGLLGMAIADGSVRWRLDPPGGDHVSGYRVPTMTESGLWTSVFSS